jgi:hypothetical protein
MGDCDHADQALFFVNTVVHEEREAIQWESSVIGPDSLSKFRALLQQHQGTVQFLDKAGG